MTGRYTGVRLQGGIVTGHVEHGTTQGIIRGRHGSGSVENSHHPSHLPHSMSHGSPPGLGANAPNSGDGDDIGWPDIRRSSAEERICPRCNINVKCNILGAPPNFHTCTMCRTSLCSACCPPSSGNCSLCAISTGRDGVLPPHVFGQATRLPVSSSPSEANKCATIEFPKEPAPHELRDWIVATREIVSNAFSYDSQCAMSRVMSVSSIEELDEDCLYPILDNRCNAALRKGITPSLPRLAG